MIPIYSDMNDANIPDEMKEHIIPLLKDDIVQGFNHQLTFIEHGIFIFPQYKSKRYIINAFSEDTFNKIVSRLYALLHDSGSDMLLVFLEIVVNDEKKMFKPFPATVGAEQQLFEKANKFVESINILRQTEQHNMKPDSKIDSSSLKKREKILKEISHNKLPETEEEWENCISWIRKNCENIVCLLNKRLTFLENDSSELQKEQLINNYYNSLKAYYKRNMYDILKEVNYRNHKRARAMYIQAKCEKNKEEIANSAIELLKQARKPVDPYKVVLQIADDFV